MKSLEMSLQLHSSNYENYNVRSTRLSKEVCSEDNFKLPDKSLHVKIFETKTSGEVVPELRPF